MAHISIGAEETLTIDYEGIALGRIQDQRLILYRAKEHIEFDLALLEESGELGAPTFNQGSSV